jgi:small-conductance mechanosensitive channel
MNFNIEELMIFVGPAIAFLITLVIGLLLRKLVMIKLSAWAKKTETEIDDIIIEALRKPMVIWCVMLALYVGLYVSHVPQDIVNFIGKILLTLGIFSITMVLANIASAAIKAYSAKADTALPATSLTQNIARIVIFGIGILIILNFLGISITPILATLGVGGLAVALALQDTLSNLFAGFLITINKQVKPGDYVKLESGIEGHVTDINWRTTKIKLLNSNIALVPNAKLAQAVIINFDLPNKELGVTIIMGVHYNSDLEKVEKVTKEVALEVLRNIADIHDAEPVVVFTDLGPYSINMSVNLRAKQFTDQFRVKHEFIKRIKARYTKENIVIPYPVAAINNSQEK